jgi:ketosteroid isomerase-like protein
VLASNAAFYEAFNSKDLPAMERVWSSRPDVTCIHPGWSPLEGRSAVMESWRSILGNQQQPKIVSAARRATVIDGIGIVFAREFVDGSPIATTNAFVREGGGWKMLLHHTSLVVQRS